MTVDKKVAIVTGAAKGIGLATAKRFYDDGFTVVINVHAELSDEQKNAFNQSGYDFEVVVGDVSDDKSAKTIIDSVFEKYGRIDVLVNNAGITRDKLLTRISIDDFKTVINTNLVGTFNMTKYVMKYMQKQRSGAIINLSSISGIHGNVGQANYSASKAGVIGLTKTAAREGALRGIRVNAVAPGMVRTDMVEAMSEKRQQEFAEQIPLKRFGNVAEIADTISFLANNKYITGQVLTVDGGLTI
ncbi:3-oxoacyl-ACP reductase family protein [Lentilactobacillus kosonis]|uniref:3-oxoacyl-[acyl-carrier protein] reductase n=1 Tax=Lentilactobacillus kosonis TaxID=2810561 RepID=A0A401FLF0_9LACO|nr:3-oxoacyl-ACP reductase family protein [Lentilactobacillus kosonis]GAY73205.1 3-oxoacyl-[acyl-carrier protein] reductase [Lentilactobacillus kosonis]